MQSIANTVPPANRGGWPSADHLGRQSRAMSDRDDSDSQLYRIAEDPRYRALVRRRGRLAWSLSSIMVLIFFGYMLLVAFAGPFLATPIGSMTTTIGIPIGLLRHPIRDRPDCHLCWHRQSPFRLRHLPPSYKITTREGRDRLCESAALILIVMPSAAFAGTGAQTGANVPAIVTFAIFNRDHSGHHLVGCAERPIPRPISIPPVAG